MTLVSDKKLQNEYVVPICLIKVNGSNVSNEILDKLLYVEVQQNLYLPSMFTLKFYSPDLDLFESNPFDMGAEVLIYMSQDSTTTQKIMTGEVTTVEIDADPGSPMLTVRGYDKLHRLQRGRRTRTFQQVKDSDLISKLASEGGLSASATATSGVYDYVLQNNETDLEFLQRRVYRLGMELYVDGSSLKLRNRSTESEVATLEWGVNLQSFVSRLTSVNQVDSVEVRGWDSKTKTAIVGTCSSSTNHPQTGLGSKGKSYGALFGSAKVASVYRPVTNQDEAQKIAQAIYDDLTGRFIHAEGSCLGDTSLVAGKWIKVDKIGAKYGGKFYLTSCTHSYSRQGYLTYFEATGRQTNSWLEISQQNAQRSGNNTEVNSVVIGIVTNNNDPENQGRVKVKFPWLPTHEGNEIESTWARLATPMAGNGRGFMFLPEVNDEVLVGFERGDVHFPFVLGSLWNGKDAPPKKSNEVVGSSIIKQRVLKTLSGHTLTFDDSADAPKIMIVDKTGKNKITIDSTSNLITIESDDGNLSLKAPKGKISLEAKDVEIKGSATAKMDSPQVQIKGDTSAKLLGAQLEIKADAQAKFEAATLEIKAQAEAQLDGGGILTVKGGLVKIN